MKSPKEISHIYFCLKLFITHCGDQIKRTQFGNNPLQAFLATKEKLQYRIVFQSHKKYTGNTLTIEM